MIMIPNRPHFIFIIYNMGQPSGMPKLHRRLVRERIMLADLESVPLIREQDPPYKRYGFRYGAKPVHRLGQVNGAALDYGIETRHTWGNTTDLASVLVTESFIEEAGDGLFANQPIQRGQLFSEYYSVKICEDAARELQLKVG